MTIEEFENFCENNTPEETAKLLNKYVKDGQPEDFMPMVGTRTMCNTAAYCYNGRYGGNLDYMDFYQYMWSGDRLPTKDERLSRHVRCGFTLDDAKEAL